MGNRTLLVLSTSSQVTVSSNTCLNPHAPALGRSATPSLLKMNQLPIKTTAKFSNQTLCKPHQCTRMIREPLMPTRWYLEVLIALTEGKLALNSPNSTCLSGARSQQDNSINPQSNSPSKTKIGLKLTSMKYCLRVTATVKRDTILFQSKTPSIMVCKKPKSPTVL